eukprot:TRINITY_DN1633_c0_g1_i5.p1 TRINITY_DN1633_c0_g1~~TRINITY_DN1633_c0_g1_i5.p1  ORF type:complete len:312 (-),score=68.62 TRINITY_DN1633_c0_g1_i5:255-1190(-)
MGCLNSKDDMEPMAYQQPRPSGYPQQQPAGYSYYATSSYPDAPPAQPGYAERPFAAYQPQDLSAPFLRTPGPTGLPWAQYVQTGACYIDGRTGFLAGPWAECIEAGVHFEHSSDWQRIPEYAGGEGPVGGILSALGRSLEARGDRQQLLEAAERLEEAAHEREDRSSPFSRGAGTPPQPYAPMQPQGYQAFGVQQPGPHFEQQPYAGQQAYGVQQPYGGQQPYGYGSQPYDGYQAGYEPGPTLLQQQSQNQGGGMGTGAKVAMGVGAAAVGVVGGVLVAEHADEIGEAFSGAADWAGDRMGDVGELVEDIF